MLGQSVWLSGSSGDTSRRPATVELRLTSEGSLVRTQLRPPGKPGDRPPIRYWGGHTGSAVLAADTVAVAVESVDVGSDHLDGPLNVGGAVAVAACTVDVAGDRDTGAAVVRVALLGFLCSYRDDPGDWRSDNYLPDQFFVYLSSVAERHLIGQCRLA